MHAKQKLIPGSNQKAEKKYSVHLKQIKRARDAIPSAWTAPNSLPLQREPALPSSDCDFPSIHYHLTQKYTTSFTFNTNPRDSPLRTETASQFTYDRISTRHLINQSRKTNADTQRKRSTFIYQKTVFHLIQAYNKKWAIGIKTPQMLWLILFI